MERRNFAVWTVVAGLLVGLIGDLMFVEKSVGLSLPLFVLIVVLVVLSTSRLVERVPSWRTLWLLGPLGFFALMVAIRASETLLILNLGAVLALGALTLHYTSRQEIPDQASSIEQGFGIIETGTVMAIAPLFQLTEVGTWLAERRQADSGTLRAVLRGLLIAVPVLLVFGALLGAADTVFASLLDQVWAALSFGDIWDLVPHAITITLLGWGMCGALAYGLTREVLLREADEDVQAEALADLSEKLDGRKVQFKPPLQLGIIEAGIVLGAIDLLFAVFVAIQFAYFFGGRVNVAQDGLTYAEYARRGYFELVTVSVLTLVLALALDWVTERHTSIAHTLFRVLSVILVALTGVMLVSAWQRMALYEIQYGFTHLRLYTHISMIWIAVLFGFFLLAMFRVRPHVFSLGVLVVLIGYLGTLNVIDVDRIIAANNIDRYHAGLELDFYTLSLLSLDTVPEVAALYEDTADTDPAAHECAGQLLALYRQRLDGMGWAERSLFSANLARDSAWAILSPLADELPEDQVTIWDLREGCLRVSREGVR